MLRNKSTFQTTFSFEKRKMESERIRLKHPNSIPIICEPVQHMFRSSNVPVLDKHKYLVPFEITMHHFILIIRQKIKLPPQEAIFLFVNGKMFSNGSTMLDIYEKEKDKDGFLYVQYAKENTFG